MYCVIAFGKNDNGGLIIVVHSGGVVGMCLAQGKRMEQLLYCELKLVTTPGANAPPPSQEGGLYLLSMTNASDCADASSPLPGKGVPR